MNYPGVAHRAPLSATGMSSFPCVHCRVCEATILVRHEGSTQAFCSPICSAAKCALGVQHIGPKHGDKKLKKKEKRDAEKSKVIGVREDGQSASDIYGFGLKHPDGRRLLVLRRIEFTPKDDLPPGGAVASIRWMVDARFEVPRNSYAINPLLHTDVYFPTKLYDPTPPQAAARLIIKYEPSDNDYLLVDRLANFMTGPSASVEERLTFRGLGTRLLRSVIFFILARHPWMLPKGSKSKIAVEAGSIRETDSARVDRDNQKVLVKYYKSLGFKYDDEVPQKLDNMEDTQPMSITVADLLQTTSLPKADEDGSASGSDLE